MHAESCKQTGLHSFSEKCLTVSIHRYVLLRVCLDVISSSPPMYVWYVQRPRKKYACFAKQLPGMARQKVLATTYNPFPGALYLYVQSSPLVWSMDVWSTPLNSHSLLQVLDFGVEKTQIVYAAIIL